MPWYTRFVDQSGRIDEMINKVPQPSEILDIRVDKYGRIFPTSRARINNLESRIEELELIIAEMRK